MRDIGKNIRAARVRRGLTQEELAERLHVSRQTVSNYETGRSRPDVEMLLRAAEQLGVDVQVLLYGEPLRPERRREICRLLAEGTALLVLGSGIFLLRQFFISIPKDLDNAARIDGAGEFRIFLQIILPNSVPAILTVGMFNFMGNWNDLLWPLIMTSKPETRTITAGLAMLTGHGSSVTPYGVVMAGALISALPLIIVFFFVQKRFVEGIAMTGMK